VNPPKLTKPSPRALVFTVLALVAALTAGCGAVAHIDVASPANNPGVGKTLFVQKCGACHTLANAKTTGVVGPNLDFAFKFDKLQGFRLSTIVDVVRGQIAYPNTSPNQVQPGTTTPVQGMTANLVHGQQARDVAVYVGMCAAVPNCGVKAQPVGNTSG
jgi:cytochrome c2